MGCSAGGAPATSADLPQGLVAMPTPHRFLLHPAPQWNPPALATLCTPPRCPSAWLPGCAPDPGPGSPAGALGPARPARSQPRPAPPAWRVAPTCPTLWLPGTSAGAEGCRVLHVEGMAWAGAAHGLESLPAHEPCFCAGGAVCMSLWSSCVCY